jgi:hypothetical protein
VKKGLTLIAIGLIVVGLLAMTSAFGHGFFHSLSFAADSERGSGNLTTETRTVGSFDRIETNLGVNLIVHIGEPQKLAVTIDDNLMALLKTEVHGHTLKISTRSSFSTKKDCTVEITVPALEAISSNGSGNIEVHDLKGGDFSFDLSGSGNFNAWGKVDKLSIQVNGSGSVNTRELNADDVDVEINGSGDATVAAKNSLDIEVNGSGSVSYQGNPEHIHQSVSGSGSVEKLKST